MVPFEYLVDSRHASKDSFYHAMDKPLEFSPAVRDRQFICGQVFLDPAVPVARQQGLRDPANFSDTVPGSNSVVVGAPPPFTNYIATQSKFLV